MGSPDGLADDDCEGNGGAELVDDADDESKADALMVGTADEDVVCVAEPVNTADAVEVAVAEDVIELLAELVADNDGGAEPDRVDELDRDSRPDAEAVCVLAALCVLVLEPDDDDVLLELTLALVDAAGE